jgi:hypothetical protein
MDDCPTKGDYVRDGHNVDLTHDWCGLCKIPKDTCRKNEIN